MTLLKRIGSFFSTLLGSVFLLALVVALVGPAMYLELSGHDATAVVTRKRELIRPNDGFWTRQLFVDVSVQGLAEPDARAAPIAVDARTFDRVAVGQPVAVRYVQNDTMRRLNNIVFARLATQPPFSSFTALAGSQGLRIVLWIAVWLVLLGIWSKWRTWWLAVGVFAFMVVSALISGSSWQAAPRGPLAAATATVRETTRVDKVWGGHDTPAEDAVQPFNIVQLEFIPAGQSEAVVAVDIVDDGSVAGLRANAQLPIHYSIADPRQARIDGGTHTYWWQNMRSFAIIGVGLVVIFGAGSLYRTMRRTQRREQASQLP